MTARPPRVSIGMPVYNGEAFLDQAIESILAQTFSDFELIISDNGSHDATEAVCRRYAAQDARIRYRRYEENRGAAWNFNNVFRLARGEYFKWAADDDLHADTFLEQCVDRLDRRSDLAWCHSRSSYIGPGGHLLSEPTLCDISYAAQAPAGDAAHTREATDPCRRFQAVVLSNGGCLDIYGVVRREALLGTMLHLPYHGAEKVLVGELALRGRYCEVPETLFYFRVHPEGSGGLAKASDQVRFENPNAVPWLTFTRWHLLCGHLTAARRAPLDTRQRVRCLGTVFLYVLQVRKWKGVLLRTLCGRGTGGAYLELQSRVGRKKAVLRRAAKGEPCTSR